MKTLTLLALLALSLFSNAQTYTDSIKNYQDDYIANHGVVKGDDKKKIHFFPISETFKLLARFEPVKEVKWFSMETSGTTKQIYRVYGYVHFSIHDTLVKLAIYQSQNLMQQEKYKNHLFLPFTDMTSGENSYAGGRYIELETTDVLNNSITIDFNKAYNPYCAYVSGKYNCPIPPKENQLSVSIAAGEMNFVK